MSRTDVHRPWRVQLADPYNRHLLYRYQMWPREAPELTSYRNIGCGCRLCTSYHWRRQERRRDRHAARREIMKAGEHWIRLI